VLKLYNIFGYNRDKMASLSFDYAFESFQHNCSAARRLRTPPVPIPTNAVKVLTRDNTAYFAQKNGKMFMVSFCDGIVNVRTVPPDWVQWLQARYII
jgi:hypothetical protein